MKIAHQLDPVLWKVFVDQNPCGNIFHTPEMFAVFSRAKGHKPVLWAVTSDEGEILALLPVVRLTLINGPLTALTTRAVAYGSVLCAPCEQGRAALRLLLQTYKCQGGQGALFTEFRNMEDLNGLQPVLNECGFIFEDHLDYIHDLTLPRETIWGNIDKRKRSKIRACQNKQVVVEDTTDPDKLKIAYGFLEGVYERVQVPVADISLFQAALDILAPRGMFRVLLARVGDEYAATSLALLYHGRIFWWYIGSDRSLGNIGASERLVWYALEWGQENGYQVFDFGGGGKPDEEYAPRQFKRQFGGVQVNYGRQVCIHAPRRLKLCTAGYQLSRRVASQLHSTSLGRLVTRSH
ncbi:MAG: GNAT family N-acetyltransferase [Chloroflexi bacterium]|nr:GNAT family N-acetyltransferase [Chloroflexota bacterium]